MVYWKLSNSGTSGFVEILPTGGIGMSMTPVEAVDGDSVDDAAEEEPAIATGAAAAAEGETV